MKMGDLGDMMKQAQELQGKMQDMQNEIANMEVIGESGAGMVRVTMNGRHDVKNVDVDPSLLTEEKTLLEGLLAAAVNDANRKVEQQTQEKMQSLTGGLNMPPGFQMPF